jgi:hypothetical protein
LVGKSQSGRGRRKLFFRSLERRKALKGEPRERGELERKLSGVEAG